MKDKSYSLIDGLAAMWKWLTTRLSTWLLRVMLSAGLEDEMRKMIEDDMPAQMFDLIPGVEEAVAHRVWNTLAPAMRQALIDYVKSVEVKDALLAAVLSSIHQYSGK